MDPVTQLSEETKQEDDLKYPSLLTRVQSIFTDLIFILVMMFIASWIIDKFEATPDWVRAVLFIGLWFVYEPLSMTFGCTLGNYLTGIRVRKFNDDTKRINLFQAYIRFIIKFFLGWLSFLTISLNPEKRAIHDYASGTVVIRIRR